MPSGTHIAGFTLTAGDTSLAGALHSGTLVNDVGMGDFAAVHTAVVAATHLSITGPDWPVLSIGPPARTPAGTPFLVRGTMVLSTSHRPVTGARVVVGSNYIVGCHPFSRQSGEAAARTSSTGARSIVTTLMSDSWCVSYGPDQLGVPVQQALVVGRNVTATVTARASAAVVRIGSSETITGTVRPSATVRLDRLVAGTWRAVASVKPASCLGPSGLTPQHCTYRLVVTPVRGTWSYRVSVLGTPLHFGTASPVFWLTAR